ncbi:MAG: YCF48-related protein [bacterium]
MKKLLLIIIAFLYQSFLCYSIDNWEVQIADNRGGFRDVFFVGQEGWAVGYSSTVVNQPSTVLYTSNNGNDWIDQNPGTRVGLNSVYFINSKKGWIVGSGSYILSTTDGGTNWNSERVWGDVNFQCITFTDDNTGWIIGDDQLNKELVLYKTTDAGENWVKNVLDLPCYSLSYIFFSDAEHGWISGNYPTYLLRTTDGGENWIKKDMNTQKSINSLFFIDENEGWAVGGSYDRINGSSILIIHTTDGGENWEMQLDTWTYSMNDVVFYDNQNGWAVGGAPAVGCGTYGSYIINTTDGGLSWESQYIPVENFLTGLFIDKQLNAWVVGVDNFGDGCILYSGLTLDSNQADVTYKLNSNKDFLIYPNPATDFIILNDELVNIEINIISLTGQVLIRTKNQKRIDVSFLSSGIYFIKTDNKLFKFVKL